MKRFIVFLNIFLLFLVFKSNDCMADKLKVVATLPDYAYFAKLIGGERVDVSYIVQGNQDAHFIRPKPSFVSMVRKADVLIATGLDLELWLPTVIDKSGNRKVRSGEIGFVAASKGVNLLEKPKVLSRIEGGVHIYGNPHITCSPVNMRYVAKNIAIGLEKNDPAGKEYYEKNLKIVLNKLDNSLYGEKLVEMFGGDLLSKLAEKDKLIDFLEKKQYEGKPLIDYLGGWMKKMLPLRGKKIVTYHKNWVYFCRLFGLVEAGTIEPKPGIPPTPKHVADLIELMRKEKIKVILAANYFDKQKVKTVAKKVGAKALIVPLYVGGEKGIDTYFDLVDFWINGLISSFGEK